MEYQVEGTPLNAVQVERRLGLELERRDHRRVFADAVRVLAHQVLDVLGRRLASRLA